MAEKNVDGSISLDLELNTEGLAEKAQEAGEEAGKALEEGVSKGVEKGSKEAEKSAEKGADRIKKSSEKTADRIKKDAQSAGESAKRSFESSSAGITKTISGLAKKLAGAFAVKKLFDFGKEAVELGSDLAEVENVVDVTFGSMSGKVDEFAKSAAKSFGLSETMAKKYTGTFGSMAKAFGFSQQEAYDMGTALTGLAGDVASFYNLSQDEAYTKLKSVFTGETESLKDLGVVMTQTALDSYAMANGFGKTTKEMTEAEKVALRYSFVQNQLSSASGDFARTSGGWANQVRILKLQFDSLKASIGQGLINVLLPVVKGINFVLERLTTLASAFKSFTEMITGNKASDGGGGGAGITEGFGDVSDTTGAAADGLDAMSEAADKSANSSKKAGKAAKKAAEEMRSLAGFDQITKLNDNSSDEDEDDADTGSSPALNLGAGSLGSSVDFGQLAEGETVLDKFKDKFKGLIDRAKELGDLFKKGFRIGFGDSQQKIDSIKAALNNIGSRLKEIFTDPAVAASANKLFDSIAYNAGRVAGSMASIGLSIANNLISGISGYLDGSADYIKDRLVGIFDASAAIADLVGDVYQATATIFDVLNGENATACTSALIGIFADGFLGIVELALKFGADIISLITGPFVDNAELIRETIDGTFGAYAVVLNTVWQAVKHTVEKAIKIYDEDVHPLFESLRKGVSEIVETFLKGYNEHMKPVLDRLAAKFREVWEEHIQPAIDGFLELVGKVADLLKAVWENVLQPLLNWIASKVWPVFAPIFEKMGSGIMDLIAKFADFAKNVEDKIGAVIDWLTQLFEHWDENWNSIKDTFTEIWQTISDTIVDVCTTIGDTLSDVWNSVRDTVAGIWDSIVEAVRDPVNTILGFIETLLDGVCSMQNGIADAFNNLSIDIPDWVPEFGGGTIGFDIPYWYPPSLPRLAQGGYVKANTPRLAMIGDNRTEGEIVSPESKMQEMAEQAARAVLAEAGGGVSRTELESIINNAVMRIIAALAQVGFYLDGQQLARLVKTSMSKLDYRYNKVEIT